MERLKNEIHVDFDRSGLIALIRSEFKLDWQGIHGANHWARVLNHGKNIGQLRKADLLVVELFGFLHDSCRLDDGRDPKHGERAAEFAHGIHKDYYSLQPKQLDTLCYALKHHSGGDVSTNVTFRPVGMLIVWILAELASSHHRSFCLKKLISLLI